MPQDSSVKKIQKGLVEVLKNFPKKEKAKIENMDTSNIKVSPKLKTKVG